MPLPNNPEDKLFYLASPYSHKDKVVMDYRYLLVSAAAAALYNKGFNLLEPIGSGHPISTKYDLPKGYEYWMRRDRLMISRSDGVIVLTATGWEESKGVTDEIQYADSLGLPVYYLSPAEVLPLEVIARYVPPLYIELPPNVVTDKIKRQAEESKNDPIYLAMDFSKDLEVQKAKNETIYAAGNSNIDHHPHSATGITTRFYDPKTGRTIVHNSASQEIIASGLFDPAVFNDEELTA